MDSLTIKLLNERRANSVRRKIEGYSGTVYPFLWNDEHAAYIFTTSKQAEADDLFKAQGRTMGCYFAPVVTIKQSAPLLEAVVLAMLERGLSLPREPADNEQVALALLAAYDKGALSVEPALETPNSTKKKQAVKVPA